MYKQLLTLTLVSVLTLGIATATPEETPKDLCKFNKDKGYMVSPMDYQWVKANQKYYPGAQIVRLAGNSQCPGPYTTLVKLPKGFQIQPHKHPTFEQVMVMSGTLNFGVGDKLDKSKSMPLKQGGYIYCPPGTPHFFWTDEETVMMIQGDGPWGLTFINSEGKTKSS